MEIRNFARLHTLLGFIIFGICVLGPVRDISDKIIITVFAIAGGLTILAMLKGHNLCASDEERVIWENAGRVMERCIIAFMLVFWLCSCVAEMIGFVNSADIICSVPMAIGVGIYIKGVTYLKYTRQIAESED